MFANLALATLMVSLTVAIHLGGLLVLLWVLRDRAHRMRAHESRLVQLGVILFVVLGLVAIHSVEIWLYGAAYWAIGAVSDFETALYFSTVTFTTLGYGDVVLDSKWRLFGAIEGGNGLILFGWSTAFLLSVTSRLRLLEHDWLEKTGSD
ncbi:potassium channel family protein [Reyranella aquatilis]|uniref:Potassium channel family protein n=1 Tax=Reyranella aquatilis TaxID=2035356 RepID=A0ABS8L0Q5_9HYPH|nr:potassium channel family protein [Reyranella aquatilis]MCC8431463.1 potassium channel family protein [Reyranella aquatilis]